MVTVLALLGVAVALFLAAVLSTREGPVLADAPPDAADLALPPGPLQPEDVAALRFSLAPRGYRMSEVDDVLDRLAAELADRDRRLALLEATIQGGTPGEPAAAPPASAVDVVEAGEQDLPVAAAPSTDLPSGARGGAVDVPDVEPAGEQARGAHEAGGREAAAHESGAQVAAAHESGDQVAGDRVAGDRVAGDQVAGDQVAEPVDPAPGRNAAADAEPGAVEPGAFESGADEPGADEPVEREGARGAAGSERSDAAPAGPLTQAPVPAPASSGPTAWNVQPTTLSTPDQAADRA